MTEIDNGVTVSVPDYPPVFYAEARGFSVEDGILFVHAPGLDVVAVYAPGHWSSAKRGSK